MSNLSTLLGKCWIKIDGLLSRLGSGLPNAILLHGRNSNQITDSFKNTFCIYTDNQSYQKPNGFPLYFVLGVNTLCACIHSVVITLSMNVCVDNIYYINMYVH